jgi:hypothetical protein
MDLGCNVVTYIFLNQIFRLLLTLGNTPPIRESCYGPQVPPFDFKIGTIDKWALVMLCVYLYRFWFWIMVVSNDLCSLRSIPIMFFSFFLSNVVITFDCRFFCECYKGFIYLFVNGSHMFGCFHDFY